MIFHKNDINMLLSQEAENWKVDSLNIESQTFCGLIEIKEIVTE